MRLPLLILSFVWLLAACATTPSAPSARPLTILISMDGLRPADVTPETSPTLARLAAEGVNSAMRPSFPSKTFPNHYTLVTGLRPDRHGVVENNMLDPDIPGQEFRLSNREAVSDPRWWAGGVPVWVTAEIAGMKTATMYWPGSEAPIRGVRPSRWLTFDQKMPSAERVDRLLAWLDEPQRPGFATLYFDEVDTAGHNDGPGSLGVKAALGRVDAAMDRLIRGLAARGVAANLVIVSDHGMAAVSPERRIYLDDIIPADAGRAIVMGPIVSFYPAADREAETTAALLRPRRHMQCWRKADLPARFAFGGHRRIAPIFCLAEVGWMITTRDWVARATKIEAGAHGYDPTTPEMAATFIAHGPAFRAGVRLRTFDNVSVYPLLMRLTGLRARPSDGRLSDTAAALR
jgi:predicted AlkP superfamily pyrophosphatase or phosphodiesterase